MVKKVCVFIAAVCFCLGCAGCAIGSSTGEQDNPYFVQDIILGSNNNDDDDYEEPPIVTEPTKEQTEQALLEQAAEFEQQIQALTDKLKALEQLKASYQAENPPDLEAKLTRCDALMADTQAELSALQERLEQNQQTRQTLLKPPDNDEPLPTEPEPAEDLE